MRTIVCIGLPASGKTTHAKIIGEKYNIPLYETGTFVFKEVEERGLEITPENIKKVTTECKKISDSYFTEKAFNYAKQQENSKYVFFSGIRAISEVEFLKKELGDENVILVGFHASRQTRFQRLNNPDRKELGTGAKAKEDQALKDFNTFVQRDLKELNFGVGTLFALSDYIIITEDQRWPYHNLNYTLREFELIVQDHFDV